jgi:hypothetical protein
MVIVPGLSIGAEVADPELFQDAVRALPCKESHLELHSWRRSEKFNAMNDSSMKFEATSAGATRVIGLR